MNLDISTLTDPTTIITTAAAAAAVEAYIAIRIGTRVERQKEPDACRADSATTSLETLVRLRDLLQHDRSEAHETR